MFLSFDSTFELDTFVHVVQYWKTLLVYSEIINLSTKIWNLSLMFIFATLFNHIGDTNKNNALTSDTEHDLLTWSKVHLPRTPEKWYICRLCSLFLEFDTAICKRCPVLHSTVNCSHCVRLRTYKKEVGDTNSKPPFKKGYRKRETISCDSHICSEGQQQPVTSIEMIVSPHERFPRFSLVWSIKGIYQPIVLQQIEKPLES